MPLFVMCCDSPDGGGTQYMLVAAADNTTAYDYMAALEVENIGCAVDNATITDVEEYIHDYYHDIAVLCTV